MIILILAIVGLCLGSFINALVWRLHEQSQIKEKKTLLKKDKALLTKLSILNGRSMCPNCKHELKVSDLIPVFSWLSLQGKCRYCAKPISWQYPIVELSTALVFIASYIWWPVAIHGYQITIFGLWLILLVGLIALLVYDLKWFLLPTRIIYSLAPIALLMTLIRIVNGSSQPKVILDEIIAIALGGGIFYILFQVSSGKWIGGGDVRLGFLLGLVSGTPGCSLLLIFLASFLGSLISLPFLFTNKLKKNSLIPYGPFLIVAVIIVQLFGHIILHWYQHAFFPNSV